MILITGVFLLAYFVPFDDPLVKASIAEAFLMLQKYAREHVLFCLIPAFFIAGAIANFISQGAVIKYFGGAAHKAVAYSAASCSGTVLGNRKTLVFIVLVAIMATISGLIYGSIAAVF